MRIFKRKHIRPTKQEIDRLFNHYRNEIMNKDIINNNFGSEDFSNLISVAKYADFGLWTAIQAAFCLGYGKGKGGAV